MRRIPPGGPSGHRRNFPLLPPSSLLLLLLPLALHHLPSTAVAEGDGADGGDAAASSSPCSQTCYPDLAETARGHCKDHEYEPGLYAMMTDLRTRRAGQSFHGDRTRLYEALRRYRAGGNLTVVAVGGSISAGQGAVDAPAYPKWLQMMMDAHLSGKGGGGGGGRVVVHNGAVPGTSSQYMSACHNVHVPQEADIVFVEYAVNDDEMPMPHMNNQVRRPYERLIRKLLNYPHKPAVVLVHAFRWFQLPVEQTGLFWATGERQQTEFGLFYGLPQLSIKACCYHHMVAGKPGYSVKRPRADNNGRLQHENFVDAMLKGNAFFYDIVHPDGNTGHRVMAELAFQLIMDGWAQVVTGFQSDKGDLAAYTNGSLPQPMLPSNYESKADKCFIGPAFQRTVIVRDGFDWINEGKNPQLPKWGFVATEPEKTLKIKVDTKAASSESTAVTVELGYLRSYENMGRAAVECESGCSCTPWFLDGHHESRTSQAFLHPFKVSQAEDCVISVKVLHESTSGKHKVKITGIMVSEEPDAGAFQNWAAFDWVGSAASRASNGVFEIGNIARRSLLSEHMTASSAELNRRYYEATAATALSGGGGVGGVAGSSDDLQDAAMA